MTSTPGRQGGLRALRRRRRGREAGGGEASRGGEGGRKRAGAGRRRGRGREEEEEEEEGSQVNEPYLMMMLTKWETAASPKVVLGLPLLLPPLFA